MIGHPRPGQPLRIFVPLDGQTRSESILPVVAPWARQCPGQILLFRVVRGPGEVPSARDYLAEVAAALRREHVAASFEVGTGDPATEISQFAHARSSDFVAMASHARTEMGLLLRGSVAESLLRRAAIPLFLIREGIVFSLWNHLVVALDGSREAEQILIDAVRLARRVGAVLHLLSVRGIHGFHRSDPLPYVREIGERLDRLGVSHMPVVRHGRPAEEIVRYAAETGASLICMTTHARKGMARAFHGSVAAEVLRSAPCPLIVGRTPAEPTQAAVTVPTAGREAARSPF